MMILGVQATAREIRQLRGWSQKCFQNADGSRTYVVRGKRWHHKVAGQWYEPAEITALKLILPQTDYYGEIVDGEISGASSVYTSARANDSASVDTGTSACVGQNFADPTYTVMRLYFSFDTSGIEDEWNVDAATLYAKAYVDFSTQDFNVQLYRYAWVETLAANRAANYDGAYGASATLEGTFRNTANGWVSGTYYSMVIAKAGINKTGDTKYTMVSSRDVAGTAPAGYEYVHVYMADVAGTTSDPYLAITVSPPSAPGMAIIF
jgi:hypothetical protein